MKKLAEGSLDKIDLLTPFFGTCQKIGEGKEYQVGRQQYAWKDRS